MVGDDWKDIMCGNKAGSGEQGASSAEVMMWCSCITVTVLLRNDKNHNHPSKAKPNFIVDSLSEIISLLQNPFTIELEK